MPSAPSAFLEEPEQLLETEWSVFRPVCKYSRGEWPDIDLNVPAE